MWLEREGVEVLGLCDWCQNGIHVDEPHHWRVSAFMGDRTFRRLFCEYCAICAGWLPMPEKAKEVGR